MLFLVVRGKSEEVCLWECKFGSKDIIRLALSMIHKFAYKGKALKCRQGGGAILRPPLRLPGEQRNEPNVPTRLEH